MNTIVGLVAAGFALFVLLPLALFVLLPLALFVLLPLALMRIKCWLGYHYWVRMAYLYPKRFGSYRSYFQCNDCGGWLVKP